MSGYLPPGFGGAQASAAPKTPAESSSDTSCRVGDASNVSIDPRNAQGEMNVQPCTLPEFRADRDAKKKALDDWQKKADDAKAASNGWFFQSARGFLSPADQQQYDAAQAAQVQSQDAFEKKLTDGSGGWSAYGQSTADMATLGLSTAGQAALRNEPGGYADRLAAQKEYQDALSSQHPWASAAGTGSGIIVFAAGLFYGESEGVIGTRVVTAIGERVVAGTGSRVAGAAAVGATVSGASGAVHGAVTNSGSPMSALQGAATEGGTSAVVGGVLAPVGQAVAPYAKSVVQKWVIPLARPNVLRAPIETTFNGGTTTGSPAPKIPLSDAPVADTATPAPVDGSVTTAKGTTPDGAPAQPAPAADSITPAPAAPVSDVAVAPERVDTGSPVADNASLPADTTPPAPSISTGEPVSVTTGEYLETWNDFFIPGILPLDGARYMGTMLPTAESWHGPLGACQISSFDEYISNPAPGLLHFHQTDGKRIEFERPFNFLSSGNAAYPHLELTAPWLKQLRLKDRGITKLFKQYPDRFYRLEKLEDLNGNALSYSRDPQGRLLRVERSDGVSLEFMNDERGQRCAATLVGVDGTRLALARYSYDAGRRMVAATCAFAMSVTYEWHATQPLLMRWRNSTGRSQTIFTYDQDGRVVHTATNGIWDNDRFSYDRTLRQTTYIPAGDLRRSQQFHYDEHENVIAEIDALGGAVRYQYDHRGFQIAATDATDKTTRIAYDVNGNIRRITDAAGGEQIYSYGPEGQLHLHIDAEGGKQRNYYDDHANLITSVDAEGYETQYARDSKGNIVAIEHADGTRETRSYDDHGWLSAVTDSAGAVTRFSRDCFGRLVATENGLGQLAQIAYAAGAGGFAVATSLTRPDGVTLYRGFDAEGALNRICDGEGRAWTYEYGAFNVLTAIVDPGGGRLAFRYDSEGRLEAVTNANGAEYDYHRDAAGRVIEEIDFDGRSTRYERDAAGRIISRIAPDGGRLVYGYDGAGRVTRIEGYGPDADGKPQAPPALVETFAFDRRGLLIAAENAASAVSFTRDRNGTIIAERANSRHISSVRDECGRRTERGIGFAAGWSGSGRLPTGFQGLTAEDIAAGYILRPPSLDLPTLPPADIVTGYHFDSSGRLDRIEFEPGSAGETPPQARASLSFKYDVLGREVARSGSAGFRLAQTYDGIGRLLSQSGGRRPAAYQPSGFGQRTVPTASATIARQYQWDRASSPIAIGDALWGNSAYSYDDNGQVSEARFGDEDGERFDYDSARNLVGAGATTPWQGGEGLGKLIPAAGDLLRGASFGKIRNFNASAGGVATQAYGPAGQRVTLAHDACGRVIERRVERKGFRPRVWRYGWDLRDRLVLCVTPDGERWRYGYDPLGRRVSKARELSEAEKKSHAVLYAGGSGAARAAMVEASGGSMAPVVGTSYLWDGDIIAQEAPLRLDGSADWAMATTWHYEPGTFRPMAKQEAPERLQQPDGTIREKPGRLSYIVTDHLGTPREMVDEGGTVRWAASYTTWGVLRGLKVAVPKAANDDHASAGWTPSGGDFIVQGNVVLKSMAADTPQAYACPIRFQGQWQDEETGLYYNRYRHYDPLATQYISPDPIGLEGGDRPQGYVHAPTMWGDPLGLTQSRRADGTWLPPNGDPNLPRPGGAAEQRSATAYRGDGYTYTEQVYARAPDGEVSIIDGVATKDGRWIAVESKPEGRSLTSGQRAIRKAIQEGKSIQLYGAKADGIPGLPKDGKVTFDSYDTRRY